MLSIAFFVLLSGDIMALDFPQFPGSPSTPSNTPAEVLIFSCKNANTGSNTTGNSSCSSSGSNSSSCSSGSGGSNTHNAINSWEMTADRPSLKTVLNDPTTTCSEAVQAAGVSNCNQSGGDILTFFTCKI